MSDKYESLMDVYDSEAERKAIQKLKELDKHIEENFAHYLVQINASPVYFTKEELHLAFGSPSHMEINRNMTEEIRPEDVTEYEKVFTTTEEYMAAVDRLKRLLPEKVVSTTVRDTSGSYKENESYSAYTAQANQVEDHWTKKKTTNE